MRPISRGVRSSVVSTCKPSTTTALPVASAASIGPVTGGSETDYVPHHIWFQYFASTANPTHARPTSTEAIGYTNVPGKKTVDPANHAYDLNDFTAAVGSGNFPAVSFIKMEIVPG